MDIESIQIFLDVYRSGSITAAAEGHFMTQPALGKRIAMLEKDLGVTLFLRGKGQSRVELTPEGKAFCDIAERILLLNEQAHELKNDVKKEYLTVASIRSAHDYVLPQLVKKLKEEHSNLCISIEEHQTAEIIDLLEKHRVDVGIIQTEAASSSLHSILLYSESYRVVFKSVSHLADQKCVRPEQLDISSCIFQVFDSPYERWFTRHWNPLSAKVRVNTTPTAVQYFSEPDDWMIVPDAVARFLEKHGFSSVPIDGELPTHCVYLCLNPDNHRSAVEWLKSSLSHLRRNLIE